MQVQVAKTVLDVIRAQHVKSDETENQGDAAADLNNANDSIHTENEDGEPND